jgi:hypothetical protein
MLQAGGQGVRTPPQILADQKAPPCPPRFLDFATCLICMVHTNKGQKESKQLSRFFALKGNLIRYVFHARHALTLEMLTINLPNLDYLPGQKICMY